MTNWTHWASQTHLTPEIANTVGTTVETSGIMPSPFSSSTLISRKPPLIYFSFKGASFRMSMLVTPLMLFSCIIHFSKLDNTRPLILSLTQPATVRRPRTAPAKCHRLIRMNLQWLGTKWVEAATPARVVFQDVSRKFPTGNELGGS